MIQLSPSHIDMEHVVWRKLHGRIMTKLRKFAVMPAVRVIHLFKISFRINHLQYNFMQKMINKDALVWDYTGTDVTPKLISRSISGFTQYNVWVVVTGAHALS